MANRTVSVLLQAEIGSYVAGMTKAAIATKGVGESAKTTGAKVNKGFDLAGRGALLLGGAVAGALVGVITKSMDFEKSMSGVQAATQATAGTMADLRDAAMKAGADTQYSATEAADAITEMAKAGVSAADIMGGGLTGALSLAAAGQIDVAQAAGIASTAMTQFKLTGDQLPHVADLLAAGAGKAMGSVDDLGMALNQAGLVASASGLNIEETTGTLAAFASAGLLGSDAGTSLKTMLQKLQNPSKEASDVMSDLGINMYDASGNFVGMASLAGQLQTKMAGLTQAERDKAMATIFGSDAVRAANVLYTQGAKGIADWTTKVNDAGYAQRQAAELTDNLAGDLERLGGAFDTFLISVGSGAQGPLRDLVQTFTGIVEVAGDVYGVISDLPGPVLAAAAAIGLLYLANGPLAGAISAAGTAIGGFTTKAAGAVSSTAGFKGAIGGLVSSISPASIAITGATLLLPTFIDGLRSLSGASDAAKAAQEGFAEALRATNGVIDESTRAAAQQALVDGDLVDVFDRAGVSSRDAIDGLLGNADAQDRVTAALQRYIVANPGTAHNENAEGARQARNSYEELAKTLGMSQQEAEYFADAAMGAAGATTATGEAAAGAKPAVDGFQQGLQEAADAASAAKQETDLFKLSLDILTGAHVSMLEVESAFQAALAGSKDAMTDLGGAVLDGNNALNMQTENGRKASDVLLGVKDSGNQLIATMIQQGATTDDVLKKDGDLRGSFIASARQMGISEEAANRLADEILGIPAERETKIRADIGQAETAIASIQTSINNLNDKTIRITTKTINENGTTSVRSNRASLEAHGSIIHPYASGGIEPMSNRIAKTVPPGTLRVIGDNVRVPESFIPQDGSARSWEIWRQTGEAMAKLGGSREFAGVSFGGGGGNGSGSSPRTVIHDNRQVVAQVDARQLSRQMRDDQRDLEFLHG